MKNKISKKDRILINKMRLSFCLSMALIIIGIIIGMLNNFKDKNILSISLTSIGIIALLFFMDFFTKKIFPNN